MKKELKIVKERTPLTERFLQSMEARSKEVKHSTAAEAATIAQKAHAGKLIIGHYSARVEDHALFLDEAKPIFENTFLAEENLKFEISNFRYKYPQLDAFK